MSRKLRLALVALALVVVVVVSWVFLLNPLRGDIASTETSIETARTRVSAAQAKLAQAEVTRAEGMRNQARLLELAKMVPQAEEIPSLLLQIQDLADQSGIDFIAISPGDPLESADFRILPLDLEFSGTFFDLSDFVYRAEQTVAGPGRLLAIKSLALQLQPEASAATSSQSVSPELKVSMTLYAFASVAAAAVSRSAAGVNGQPSAASSETSAGENATPSGSDGT